MNRDELYHYGVPGMKWRHHKYISKAGKNYVYALRDGARAAGYAGRSLRPSRTWRGSVRKRYNRIGASGYADGAKQRLHRANRQLKRGVKRNIGRGMGEVNYLRSKTKYVGTSKIDPQLRKGYYTAKNGATSAYKKIRNTAADTYDSAYKKAKKKAKQVRNYASGYQRMRQNKKRAANY